LNVPNGVGTMKVTFWLLDLNYEAKAERPEIRIWGISASGERILIIDRNMPSYFYAIAKEETEPVKLVEEIKEGDFPSITKLEAVERKFFGRPVKAVKVYCNDPNAISEIGRAHV